MIIITTRTPITRRTELSVKIVKPAKNITAIRTSKPTYEVLKYQSNLINI